VNVNEGERNTVASWKNQIKKEGRKWLENFLIRNDRLEFIRCSLNQHLTIQKQQLAALNNSLRVTLQKKKYKEQRTKETKPTFPSPS